MHRIDHSTREEDLFGAGKDGFTEGDPQTAVPATIVTADWANSVQEELARVVEAGIGALDKPTLDQVRESIPLIGFKVPFNRTMTFAPLAITTTALTGDRSWRVATATAEFLESNIDRADFWAPLPLPDGVVLTAARVLVDPGAARSTASERMRMQIVKRTVDWSTPGVGSLTGVGSEVESDGTSNVQVLAQTGMSETIAKNSGVMHFLHVEAGIDSGTNRDRLYAIRLDFTDPGPGRV